MSLSYLYRFYYMSPLQTILLYMLFGCGFAILYYYCRNYRWWKPASLTAFILFAILLIVFTVATRPWGSKREVFLIPGHAIYLYVTGQNPDGLRGAIMNGFMYTPLGILGYALQPAGRKNSVKLRRTVLAGFLLSVGAETLQYLAACGETEIDDVISNTIGTLAGSATVPVILGVCRAFRQKLRQKQ